VNPIDPHADYYPHTEAPPYRPQRVVVTIPADMHEPTTLERISERLQEASRQLYALPNPVSPALDDAYVAIGDAIILTMPRLEAVLDIDADALWLTLDTAIAYAQRKLESIDCPAAHAFVQMARDIATVEADRVVAEHAEALT